MRALEPDLVRAQTVEAAGGGAGQVVPRGGEARREGGRREYVRKAQRTDQTYCGTAPGTVGPVEARLRTFDKTVPLVFGAFGEASAAVEQLIDALAEAGADVHWRAMKAKKREEAKGALVWQLRRRWGMAAIRGNARLILDRMQFVECPWRPRGLAGRKRCGDARGARISSSSRRERAGGPGSCLGSVRASGTRRPGAPVKKERIAAAAKSASNHPNRYHAI